MLTYDEIVAINLAIEPQKGGIATGKMNAHNRDGAVDLRTAITAVANVANPARQSAELALRIMFCQPFGDGNHRTAAFVVFANMLHHQIGVRRQFYEVLQALDGLDDSDDLPSVGTLQNKVIELAEYIGGITKAVPDYAHAARRQRLFEDVQTAGDILAITRDAQKDFYVQRGNKMLVNVTKRDSYKDKYSKTQRDQIARCIRAMGMETT